MEMPPGPDSPPLGDLYHLLQVAPSADPEVIDAAYRALTRAVESSPGPDAAVRLARLRLAYRVLGDSGSRREYDLARGAAPGPPSPGADRGEADPHPAFGTPLPHSGRGAGGEGWLNASDESSEDAAELVRGRPPGPPADVKPDAPGARARAVAWLASGPAWSRLPLARPHPAPETLALGALLLFALVIRVVALGVVPPNVTADEADNLQIAYHIAAGQGAPGFFGLDWRGSPAFSVYLMTAGLYVFGWSIAGMRMASAILATLAIIPFYMVARQRLSARASLAAAFLLATDLLFVHFSRSGWENAQAALFAMMAAWMLTLALRRRGLRYYALAGLWCALGLYGYFTGRLIVLSLLLYLPFALRERRGKERPVLVGYAAMLLVCLGLFAPQLRTALLNWGYFTSRTSAVAITSVELPYQGATTLAGVALRQVERNARGFLLLDGAVINNARYFPANRPLFGALTGALYLIGLIAGLIAWRRLALWWCLLAPPLLATELLTLWTPDLARAVPLVPAMCLFVGYGFDRLAPRPGSRRRVLQLAAVLLLPGAAYANLSGYADWMSQPQTAEMRGPAVEPAEFAVWQALQMQEATAGRWGFTAGQWQERRGQYGFGAAASPQATPAAPTGRSVAQPAVPVPRLGHFAAAAPADLLAQPRGVASDADGSVYVADAARSRVVKLGPDLRPALAWGQEGSGNGAFTRPWDIAVDGAGHVYVLDSDAQLVQRFDAAGQVQARLLDKAGLYRPRGIAVDSAGLLYVADTGRNRVVRASPNGEVLAIIGAGGSGASLEQPTDVAVDADGYLYVAEPVAKRIQKLDRDGHPVARWETPPADTLDAPHLAVAGRWLFATSPGHQRVDVYGLDGVLVGYLGGSEATDGLLSLPVGVAADAAGRVYVADVRGATVQGFETGE